jgi:large subunit ribosomal protein L24
MSQTVSIKKNDEVEVVSGKDRGKRGRVVNVLPREGRVQVEGVARATRHLPVRPARGSTRGGMTGGLVTKELFVDISNVMLVCKGCGKPTRVGHRIEQDGTKIRVCRRCEGEL